MREYRFKDETSVALLVPVILILALLLFTGSYWAGYTKCENNQERIKSYNMYEKYGITESE